MYVNHGPFEMTEISDGMEGFLEFLNKDINNAVPHECVDQARSPGL